MDAMRERSGTVESKDKLVCFLYTLMRDHLATGDVEALAIDANLEDDDNFIFTNGWLAEYAKDIASRLKS